MIDFIREAWENSKPLQDGKRKWVSRARIKSPLGELLYIIFALMVPLSILYFHSYVLLYLSLGFTMSLFTHELYREERALVNPEKKKREAKS